MKHSPWLFGPKRWFLSSSDQDTPETDESVPLEYDLIESEIDKEIRPAVTVKKLHIGDSLMGTKRLVNYSTWNSLVSGIAKLKHIARCWSGTAPCRGWHICSKANNVDLYTETEKHIIREVQREVFGEEIRCITEGRELNKNNSLMKLNPFIDCDGILRVGGRLKHSELNVNERNPIVIPDEFSTLTDDEVSVLLCFLFSYSGPPDFTDTEWLDLLNAILRRFYRGDNPVTRAREEAQQTLDRLKARDYLWEDQDKITNDTKDETMYKIASIDRDLPFLCSSYDTASVYLRSEGYYRKPGEKCVISPGRDHLLIRRLQMNILTHVTMEDTRIYDKIYRILNVSDNILRKSEDQRMEFLTDLRREGEAVHYRGRSQDSVDHVTWLLNYGFGARPDIVRSCIGLHPHNDIYIIDNKAYRKTRCASLTPP
ncbi:uncharacterized protein LOC134259932 [Saccostrea cucullata]|uniref:uncharacterized protein LOC134259932 n=1 Tax=Saccostrea cuccullata TaxID=36930 RepID=UPI002ED27CDD